MRSVSVSTRRCLLYERLHVSAAETKTSFFKVDNQEYCIVWCCLFSMSVFVENLCTICIFILNRLCPDSLWNQMSHCDSKALILHCNPINTFWLSWAKSNCIVGFREHKHDYLGSKQIFDLSLEQMFNMKEKLHFLDKWIRIWRQNLSTTTQFVSSKLFKGLFSPSQASPVTWIPPFISLLFFYSSPKGLSLWTPKQEYFPMRHGRTMCNKCSN